MLLLRPQKVIIIPDDLLVVLPYGRDLFRKCFVSNEQQKTHSKSEHFTDFI